MWKVLIIEDDPMVAKINREFTEKLDDFEVIDMVDNKADVINCIREKTPDLLLLDIYLPQDSGVKILKSIRKQELFVDIIVITAANNVKIISEVFSYGVFDYIIKPFDFDRFKGGLEKYKKYKEIINRKEELSQKRLDNIQDRGHSSQNNTVKTAKKKNSQNLPKGVNETTLNKVVDLMKNQKGTITASELSRKLSFTRITARRYLEYLVKQGEVKVKLKYGEVGRPTKRYYIED